MQFQREGCPLGARDVFGCERACVCEHGGGYETCESRKWLSWPAQQMVQSSEPVALPPHTVNTAAPSQEKYQSSPLNILFSKKKTKKHSLKMILEDGVAEPNFLPAQLLFV